jgi:hypothetical protein
MKDRFESDPDTEAAIIDAVMSILAERRHEMTTKVIVIAETMDGDGHRAVWTCASKGLSTWDESGLLINALNKIRNTELIWRLAQSDED